MFNDDFDPYQQLLDLEKNQQQIVLAINSASELLTNLNQQVQELEQQNRALRRDRDVMMHKLNQIIAEK